MGTLVTPRVAERESQPVCLEMCVFEMTGNNKRIKERKRGRVREGEVVREGGRKRRVYSCPYSHSCVRSQMPIFVTMLMWPLQKIFTE